INTPAPVGLRITMNMMYDRYQKPLFLVTVVHHVHGDTQTDWGWGIDPLGLRITMNMITVVHHVHGDTQTEWINTP
ncbi:hypothetical protein PSZ81_24340, partial [Shigella sonnei]|nr:hypothetical protein [Shigella sonnei]